MKLIRALSLTVQAIRNCEETGNDRGLADHTKRLLKLGYDHLPSGAGIDNGTEIVLDESSPECLVFRADFHHMNENGMYDGWTQHTIKVRPSFAFELAITVSGRDRNDVKAYLADLFAETLIREVPE